MVSFLDIDIDFESLDFLISLMVVPYLRSLVLLPKFMLGGLHLESALLHILGRH